MVDKKTKSKGEVLVSLGCVRAIDVCDPSGEQFHEFLIVPLYINSGTILFASPNVLWYDKKGKVVER